MVVHQVVKIIKQLLLEMNKHFWIMAMLILMLFQVNCQSTIHVQIEDDDLMMMMISISSITNDTIVKIHAKEWNKSWLVSENGLTDTLVDVVVKQTTNIKSTEQINFIKSSEMVSTAQQTISEATSNSRTILFYPTGKLQFPTSWKKCKFYLYNMPKSCFFYQKTQKL